MRRLFVILTVGLAATSCREMTEQEANEVFAEAEAALSRHEWTTADESFQEAILLDPDRPEAWIGRGMTLTKLGEAEAARIHYEEALSLYEKAGGDSVNEIEEIRRRVMLLVLLGRGQEAAALAEQTASEHPEDPAANDLLSLTDRLEREFAEMILPRDDEEEFPTPILDND